ncbi:MAG TPA: hypothetical protein VK932_14135 [Kofleriaceae bacterium]|nr:hypothetical protein [Kofleriaceae bacterium]
MAALVPVLVLAAALVGCSVDAGVSRTLGARCDSADECDDRCLRTPAATFPGGFCSVSCEASGECQGGATCIDVVGGVCLFDCVDDLGCAFLGEGWGCFELPLREDAERRVRACLGG